MNSDRLLSIAGGVSFFVLLAIFPAVTALVSAYGLFFNTSTITDNLSLLNDGVPDSMLNSCTSKPAESHRIALGRSQSGSSSASRRRCGAR